MGNLLPKADKLSGCTLLHERFLRWLEVELMCWKRWKTADQIICKAQITAWNASSRREKQFI